jgi:hypothetical protein
MEDPAATVGLAIHYARMSLAQRAPLPPVIIELLARRVEEGDPACVMVVAFAGAEYDPEDRERTARQVFIAARSVYPIVGISEREDRLSELLRQASRINLTCGPIDNFIIRETMRAVLGEVSEGGITHERRGNPQDGKDSNRQGPTANM